MSKRDLKKYLQELDKTQLEEQIVELYDKFSPVKVYYDFVFNPNEKNLIKDYKIKVSNEYYPISISGKPRRPKMRRSVAQKYIKQFILLGVDSFLIADAMLYSIEIAQTFSAEKLVKSETFYRSTLSSFTQAVRYMIANGILEDFRSRIVAISNETIQQNWFNKEEFNAIIERFEY